MVDYMVMEAVAIRVGKEEQDARKKEEVERWQKERAEQLEPYR